MSVELNQNRWICTIDLDNVQQNYAECLQLILWMEEIAKYNLHTELSTPTPFSTFYISRAGNMRINTLSALKQQEKLLELGESKVLKKITTGEQLLSGLAKEPGDNKFSYYFRIRLHDDENDITDLQYFVLMLQTIPDIHDRMAVRLMTTLTSNWHTEDYFRVSHFLRFIQQRYSCFYACYTDKVTSLTALRQDAVGTQSTFLPLLEINSPLYQILNKTWKLEHKYQKESYEKLFTTIGPQNCKKDSIVWLLFQIGLRMLFKNLPGRSYSSSKRKQELLDFLCRLIEDMQGITPLDMLLFGALSGEVLRKQLDYAMAKDCLGRIQMLSLAVSQVLENIINHSERGCGVFTFRLQHNIEYLHLHYPDYEITGKFCLELLIADSNRHDGIVQHFLKSNKADASIKDRSNNIYLSHLFGDYQDREMKMIWQKARENRPEMCHGLISFSNSVRKLNGAVQVRSTPEFKNSDFKNIYYYNGTDNNYETDVLLKQSYIPGTQFSVAINHIIPNDTAISYESSEDWAFDFDKLVYATTYRELAQSLTFDETVRNFDVTEALLETFSISELFSQKEKDNATERWISWFNSHISREECSHKVVYQCDLDELCKYVTKHPAMCETFCKGFLSSKFFIQPDSDVYYSILLQNPSALFSRVFASTLQTTAMSESFSCDNTCVYFYPKRYQGEYLPYCATTLHDLIERPLNEKIFPRVFPYTLFLKDEKGYTLFEQELVRQANMPIFDNENQGYKVPETHMRLGNKVHLDTFYEMALFFENPNYAYYTAFLFLRTFLHNKNSNLRVKDKLLFYGYASYSRAIVWAVIQILTHYKTIANISPFPEMAFVIYQNDLKLESEQPQVQMYYSREAWQRDHNKIWNPEDTALVMIVPISSSLTTFDKMIAELNHKTGKVFTPLENYTAFWVRNNYTCECKPTTEEEPFWKNVKPKNKIITKNSKIKIRYQVSATSKWRKPLDCKKCFPKDPIMEYPLVETDPTSTVPTQQFYCEKKVHNIILTSDTEQERENDERIARLKTNIIYGHVSKGSNHYQYYVKTKVYFQQEREKVAEWLKKLRNQAIERNEPSVISSNCINILIIPQQSSNVEFGQYIYEYYFQGSAECIVINTEKEFRSNLKAEYSGLFNRLRAIKNQKENIRFHYVDVSVHSGGSFSRAVSLISSCIADSEILLEEKTEQKYDFRFDQVFLLISRLSEDSKRMYVKNPKHKFHAYAELHISAMRNFGDSCVPCKLQQEAERYYKKAATKSISSYWEKKIHKRACISFDQIEESAQDRPELQEEGYQRMICSHRAAHYIRPIQGAELPIYFTAVRYFLDEIRCINKNTDEKDYTNIYKDINDENRKDWLAAGLKIIARPFFSFDYKMRCVVMDLYLLLSEYLINDCGIDELRFRLEKANNKKYLLEHDNLNWIVKFADNLLQFIGNNECERLEFIRNNILKSLADIKSNYILRKNTIINLSKRLENINEKECTQTSVRDFYEHYLRSILRMTHSSSDETKSIWLEHLLQYGEEYSKDVLLDSDNEGIEHLVSMVPSKMQKSFRDFLEILLVENNRPLYQATVELDKRINGKNIRQNDDVTIQQKEITNLLQEHHMRNAEIFLSFSYENFSKNQLFALGGLLRQLNEESRNISRYQRLGERIQKILPPESNFRCNVILFGIHSEQVSLVSKYLHLPNYFTLFPEHFEDETNREKNPEKQAFEQQWGQIEKNSIANETLKKNGFYLLEVPGQSNKFNVVIMLDNNYDDLLDVPGQEIMHQKIEPIYIFIPCYLHRQRALELTRMILMFRRKLIEWLEDDFNNSAIAVLSRLQNLAKLLSMDKMGDHAENDFVECQQRLLMATTENEFKIERNAGNWEYAVNKIGKRENLYELPADAKSPIAGYLIEAREWFSLCSYVNSRISRLFRTMVRGENELEKTTIIDRETYYSRDEQSLMMRPAYDLQSIFFTPVKVGYIRKNYLRQMMRVITFSVQGEPDYGQNKDASIDERIENLSTQLSRFRCISFSSSKSEQSFTYLSEYLAIILLDCFVSGLKAGKIWNQTKWDGEAFRILDMQKASDKCEIELFRESGNICSEKTFDYLVIRNSIYHPQRSEKKGPGMSQAAIRWYIESLWRSCLENVKKYPEVLSQKKNTEYTIKLPILEKEDIDYGQSSYSN